MKQRIVTGVVFTLAVACCIVPGFWTIWPPLAFVLAIAIVVALELAAALEAGKTARKRNLFLTAAILTPLPLLGTLTAQPGLAVAILLLLPSVIFLGGLLFDLSRKGPQILDKALLSNGLILYFALPAGCAVLLLTAIEGGFVWFLMAICTPWIGDVFAYFAGSTWGRRLIVPRLSPKKTWAGCLGGLAGAIGAQALFVVLFFRGGQQILSGPLEKIVFIVLSGLLIGSVAQIGDWLASALKRYCTLKDFGTVLPGHGGLMDRFDSVFMTLPFITVLAVFLSGFNVG